MYCVYEHWLNGTLIYVGSCKFSELHNFPDAKHYLKWRQLTNNCQTAVHIKLVEIFNDQQTAIDKAHLLAEEKQALCNVAPRKPRELKSILCIETQVIYENIVECANDIDVTVSELKKYLDRRRGHMTISRLTFQRLE